MVKLQLIHWIICSKTTNSLVFCISQSTNGFTYLPRNGSFSVKIGCSMNEFFAIITVSVMFNCTKKEEYGRYYKNGKEIQYYETDPYSSYCWIGSNWRSRSSSTRTGFGS